MIALFIVQLYYNIYYIFHVNMNFVIKYCTFDSTL